jgi:hypothetical protein
VRLHSAAFEEAIKRSVKLAVRNDHELQKEFSRSNKSIRPRRGPLEARLVVSLVLAGLVWAAIHVTHHVDSALMIINLWILTTVPFLAQSLLRLPFHSRDILALRMLPVAESTIFRWELDKFLKGALVSFVDLMVGFGTLGLVFHLTGIRLIGMLTLIPLTWFFMLALAGFGASRFPRLPYVVISGNLRALWFIALAANAFIGATLLTFIDHVAPAFNLLAPTGWPLSLFHLLLPDGQWLFVLMILPIGLVLWTCKDSIRILRGRFSYREHVLTQAPELVPGQDSAETLIAKSSSNPTRRSIGVTAIEEGILSGQFLSRDEWNQGWLEKRLWRWFNEREKTLAEFAFPKGLVITKAWKRIVCHFLITLLLTFAASLVNSVLELSTFGIGLFIVFAQATGQILVTGSAFRVVLNSGVRVPLYAAYPITFRNLSRTLFKCSLIQLPFFAFLVAVTLIFSTLFSGLTVGVGILIAVNASIIFLGARYFLLVFAFSAGTNKPFGFWNLAQLAFFVAFGLLFLILGVFALVFSIMGSGSGLLLELQPILWMCCLLALLVGYAFFRIYGWFYHANRFDLMSRS